MTCASCLHFSGRRNIFLVFSGHLEPHADGGMLAVLEVKKKNGLPHVPRDYPACGGRRLT